MSFVVVPAMGDAPRASLPISTPSSPLCSRFSGDPLRLQLGVEAERRVSPIVGLLGDAGGGADQRFLGQASVEW